MRYRISRVAVHQTALVMAILYGVLALVVVPFVFLAGRMAVEGSRFPAFMLVLLPLVYALFAYVFTAIACWLYNLIAGWVGGIELTLDPRPDAEIPASVRT